MLGGLVAWEAVSRAAQAHSAWLLEAVDGVTRPNLDAIWNEHAHFWQSVGATLTAGATHAASLSAVQAVLELPQAVHAALSHVVAAVGTVDAATVEAATTCLELLGPLFSVALVLKRARDRQLLQEELRTLRAELVTLKARPRTRKTPKKRQVS